ncbi:hypothetical protein niasHT_019620 [Heterodera trifolii]|uniref:Uncharacterized protein n=1 Tax=Heterodera trifolii TaxID=157864 RepID=A0ABD2L827_9BILA
MHIPKIEFSEEIVPSLANLSLTHQPIDANSLYLLRLIEGQQRVINRLTLTNRQLQRTIEQLTLTNQQLTLTNQQQQQTIEHQQQNIQLLQNYWPQQLQHAPALGPGFLGDQQQQYALGGQQLQHAPALGPGFLGDQPENFGVHQQHIQAQHGPPPPPPPPQ